MTEREQIIFERALCMCASEHGYTREEMLAWLNDDTQEWVLDYQQPTIEDPNSPKISFPYEICYHYGDFGTVALIPTPPLPPASASESPAESTPDPQ
jgi:hypothetical protein